MALCVDLLRTETPPRRRRPGHDLHGRSPGSANIARDVTTGSPVPFPRQSNELASELELLSPKMLAKRSPMPSFASTLETSMTSPHVAHGKENVPPKPAAWSSPSPARTPAKTPAKGLEALPTVQEMKTLDCAPPRSPVQPARPTPPGLPGADRLEAELPSHLVKNTFLSFHSPERTSKVREFASVPRDFAPEDLRLAHTPVPPTPAPPTPSLESLYCTQLFGPEHELSSAECTQLFGAELDLSPVDKPQQQDGGNVLRLGDFLDSPTVPPPPLLTEFAPSVPMCGTQPAMGWAPLMPEQPPSAPPSFMPQLPEGLQCAMQAEMMPPMESALDPSAVLAQAGLAQSAPAACVGDPMMGFGQLGAFSFPVQEQQAWGGLPQPPAAPPQLPMSAVGVPPLQPPATPPQAQPAQPQLHELLGLQPMPQPQAQLPQVSPQHQQQQQLQMQQLQALLGMHSVLPPAPGAVLQQPSAPLAAPQPISLLSATSPGVAAAPTTPAPSVESTAPARWADTPVDALYTPPAPAAPPATKVSISVSHFQEPGAAAASSATTSSTWLSDATLGSRWP